MAGPYFMFYQSAMVLSLLASVFVFVLTWHRRQAPGAGALLVLFVSTFVWTLGFLLEANSDTLGRQLFFNNIGYIGSMSVPVAWFIFAMHYTGANRLVTGWRILPLCLIPVATVVLVWTNNWHHLMWFNEHLVTSGPFTVTVKTYGTFFWIAYANNYILIVTGAIVLIRRLFVGAPLYTGQAVSLIVAVVLPLIWNFIYVFDLVPMPRKDLTPVMFAISGIAITLGVMRFQLLTAVPFAREFLIRQLNDGIFVFDMNDRLMEANPAALAVLGTGSSIIGKSAESLPVLSPALERLPSASGSVELPLAVSGGERFFELERATMVDNRGRQVGWLAILHDITEIKKMQQQLIVQDRLASIGELTSGIAHELNNPLTSIIGFSDFLLKREMPEDVRGDLSIINSEAQRAARIVDSLLTFARNEPQEKLPVDINGIVEKTLELRAYKQKLDNIHTVPRLAPDLPRIMGNDFQLRQVFLNIIINAEFFMVEAHGEGTLTIVTKNAGGSVRISFTDDGPGILPENMPRLFSPFFTTKGVGKGTGLGLSICHGIIAGHGGKIWAESTPDKGAAFVIELPVYKRPETGNGQQQEIS